MQIIQELPLIHVFGWKKINRKTHKVKYMITEHSPIYGK